MSLDPTQHFETEPGTVAWDRLSAQVDALSNAWQGDELPPDLGQFLGEQSDTIRRLLLVELIKVDLDYRWLHNGLPKKLEEYVAEFPELAAQGEIPCDLIYEEFHIRSQSDEPPRLDEYFERFPQQAQQLRRLVDAQTNKTTSTIIGARRSPELDVGQQIDDFDLLTKLGKGAFASVYLARQRSMQRLVALKISRDRGDEPQTLAQLDHPHIVRVFDQRIVPEKQLRLMYMQVVAGGTLHGLVDLVRHTPPAMRNGRLVLKSVDAALDERGESPPSESAIRRRLASARWPEVVCWLGARLASALDYAHQRGVLHRDVKPANVLLSSECSPKLADFNVSFSSKVAGATPAAYFGGSLAYMSPEQLEASNPAHWRQPNELDGRSDVFSVGVVLWELLTGTRPYGEEHFQGSWIDTLKILTERRHAGLTAEMIATLPRELPAGLQEILLSCLNPDANLRPTAAMLSRQLELCLQPRVGKLFRPRRKSWQDRARSHPILATVIAGVVPNLIFSVLNIVFNFTALVENLPENVKIQFQQTMIPVVNGLAYVLGISLILYLVWPILRAVGKQSRQQRPIAQVQPTQDLARYRRRCTWMGDTVAWLTLSFWVGSGFAFAVWIHLELPEDQMDQGLFAHFLPTQLIFGLIVFAQVYFTVTLVMLQAFYTALLPVGMANEEDAQRLRRLYVRSGWFFGVAITTPFVAMLLLATMEGAYLRSMGTAAIGGFLCSLTAWYLLRMVQTDAAVLAHVLEPGNSNTSGSDLSSSSLTGSSLSGSSFSGGGLGGSELM